VGTPFLSAAQINIAAGAKTTPGNYSTTFSYPNEFGPSNAKSVGSSSLGLSGLLSGTATVSILNVAFNTASSLIANLALPALNTLLSSLDNALILPLSQALDIKFGGADIAALGYKCNGLRLAA